MASIRLDGVRLGVADLDDATRAYTTLLGVQPTPGDGDVRRFPLAHGVVELAAGSPGLHAVRFLVDGPLLAPLPSTVHGLAVRFAAAGEGAIPADEGVPAIDHVVVQSPDPERAIAFWRDRMGLHLALDREFPERGLRLVFFRSAGITLEYASGLPSPAERNGPDRLHGVSYRVTELAAHRDRLLAAGVDVSPIRRGMRPGTSVATVRSGTAGVPTLLLHLNDPARD